VGFGTFHRDEPLIEPMNIDAWVIQPALNAPLYTLGKFSSTRHIGDPFGKVDAARMNHGNHQPDASG